MSLTVLKNSSAANFAKLTEKVKAMSNPARQNDDRFWQPTVDKAGNGYAVIRFLPTPDPDETPWVRVWDHGFKGPGGWYIENSLTSIGLDDPATEYNNVLWNSGVKSDKDIVSGTPNNPGSKRRLHYTANILVVEDSAKPENNGQVFLYKFGKKIFEKIENSLEPKFPDQPKVNPFDMWKGANFKLRIQKVDGQRNYNDSSFDVVSPVAKTDAGIEEIYKKTYVLAEFLNPKNYKSYADLKAKLDRVLGGGGYNPKAKTVEEDNTIPPQTSPKREAPKAAAETPPWDTEDEDDDLAMFKKLVNE